MRRTWTLAIESSTHRLDVEWDVTLTSRGRAAVDGVVVREWWTGVKLPGAAESFAVAGRTVSVRQTWFDFALDLRAAPDVRVLSGPPPYAGSGRNLSRPRAIAFGVAIAIAVVALLAGAVITGIGTSAR